MNRCSKDAIKRGKKYTNFRAELKSKIKHKEKKISSKVYL